MNVYGQGSKKAALIRARDAQIRAATEGQISGTSGGVSSGEPQKDSSPVYTGQPNHPVAKHDFM